MEKKKLGQWMLLAVVCLSFSVGEIYAQKHEFADFKLRKRMQHLRNL